MEEKVGVEIPVGYGQAALVFQLAGVTDQMVCTIGFDAPGDFAASNVAQRVWNAWRGNETPFNTLGMPVGWTFQGVRCTINDISGTHMQEHVEPISGTYQGQTLPPNCSILIRKGTARGGRKGRGRMFLPPFLVMEGGITAAGYLDPSNVQAINDQLSNCLDNMVTEGVPAVLLHQDGSLPDAITSLTCQGQIATQRRRLR